MECSVSEIRRALVAFGLLAGLVSAVLMFASPPVAAGPANLTVYGYVYDNGAQPLEGAGVVVEVLAGTFPSESATTDVDGFYMVEFDLADWQIGDTVRTTVTYSSNQEYEEAPAEADTTMQIDVTFSYAIPEFGSFAGVVVATVLMGSVAIISMRRQRTE